MLSVSEWRRHRISMCLCSSIGQWQRKQKASIWTLTHSRYWTRSVEVAACSKHTSKRIVSWQLQGEVVAALMITYEWSDWRNCQLWWIQSVYVHPDHRRKGFFRQLYKYVRQAAEQAQAGGLRLYADTTNEKAHATEFQMTSSSTATYV
ncbi:hypothetical protein ABBQ32_012116 [Trebouxia sp. C0010 RCD-2024]